MPSFRALAFVCFLAPFAQPASGQDTPLAWPRFRGPDGLAAAPEGKAPQTWSATENLLWKFPMPGIGTSSPIVVGKHIYLTYSQGADASARGSQDKLSRHILCLDLSGKKVWDEEVQSALPEKGQSREPHGFTTATPVSDGERLYLFFGRSGVFAFSLEGKQLWNEKVGDGLHEWGSAASPILYKDLVIVNASVESKTLFALDKATGKVRWQAKGMIESWNTPILVKNPEGKMELVVAIMGKVLGFDPDTGDPLWSCATDIPWYMVPSMVHGDGIVYCIGGRNPGGALAVRTGGKGDVTRTHRLWAIKKGSNVASPIYHKGHVYWANDNLGIFYCAEASSGKLIYEERAPRPDQYYSSPVLVGDKIYYVGRNGMTFVLPAEPTFKILATNDLRDRTQFNSSPAAFDGKLLIRSDANLYCVGAK